MDDVNTGSLRAFRERLAAERMRLVRDEAIKPALPAAGFIAHLADLDSAIAAVEAVIEESDAAKVQPRAA